MGVATLSDAKLLSQEHNVVVTSCLDLRMLCDSTSGLATLTSEVLGMNLEKNKRITCSDWAADELSPKQVLMHKIKYLCAFFKSSHI